MLLNASNAKTLDPQPSVFAFANVFKDELILLCHSGIAVPSRVSESQ